MSLKLKFFAVLFIFILLFNFSVKSQSEIDSTYKVFKEMKADSTSLDELLNYISVITDKNPQKALQFCDLAITSSAQIRDSNREALSYKAKAICYGTLQKPDEAKVQYLRAFEIYNVLGNELQKGNTLLNIGAEFGYASQHDSAMYYYMKALPVFQNLKDDEALGKAYNNMAVSYRNLGMLSRAIKHHRLSLHHKKRTGNEASIMNSYLNIGALYYESDNLDSASIYLNLSKDYAIKLNDSIALGMSYLNLSMLQNDLGNWDQAMELIQNSKRIYTIKNNPLRLIRVNSIIAGLHAVKENCDSALFYIQESRKYGEEYLSDKENLQNYKVLALCAELRGDYQSAFQFKTQELVYNQRVNAEDQRIRLAELSRDFEESEAKAELLLKEKEIAEFDAKGFRLQAIAFAGIGTALFAGIVALMIYHRSRKRRLTQEARINTQMKELEVLRERFAHLAEINEDVRPISIESEHLNSYLLNPLTERELEVLNAIARGKSNKEIADELFVSVNTIKTHINKVYEKLDVSNRTQATIKASKLKIVKES